MLCVIATTCIAQEGAEGGHIVIWPSGGPAFPAGRFGETDLDPQSLKPGHKTGYNAGLAVGWALSDQVVIGLAVQHARFDMDLDSSTRTALNTESGRTTATLVEFWGRSFLRGGFVRWRPYVLLGVGLGRPRGVATFVHAIPIEDQFADRLESTVGLSAVVSAGLGVAIPLTSRFAATVDARYRSVSSKGTDRTDKFFLTTGGTVDVKYGRNDQGERFRLKARANTDWWEIRVGVALRL